MLKRILRDFSQRHIYALVAGEYFDHSGIRVDPDALKAVFEGYVREQAKEDDDSNDE